MPKFSEIVRQNLDQRRETIGENQTAANWSHCKAMDPNTKQACLPHAWQPPNCPDSAPLTPSKVILKFHSLLKLFLYFLPTNS